MIEDYDGYCANLSLLTKLKQDEVGAARAYLHEWLAVSGEWTNQQFEFANAVLHEEEGAVEKALAGFEYEVFGNTESEFGYIIERR